MKKEKSQAQKTAPEKGIIPTQEEGDYGDEFINSFWEEFNKDEGGYVPLKQYEKPEDKKPENNAPKSNSYAEEKRSMDIDDIWANRFGVDQSVIDKINTEAEEKRGKDIFTESVEHSVWNTSAGITGVLDFTLGNSLKGLGWENNVISEWNKYYQTKEEEKWNDVMEAAERTGKGKLAENAAISTELLLEMFPDIVLTYLSGGTAKGVSLAGKTGKTVKALDSADDLAEYNKMKNLLGNNAPASFDDFKYLKYNNKKEYDNLINFYNYKNYVPQATLDDYHKTLKLEEKGIVGIKSIPPKNVNVEKLEFRDSHAGRHGCTEEQAKMYVRDAKCSITKNRWDGISENYYSAEGATFVDLETGLIKTSFSKKDFDSIAKDIMEVFE